jgi:hypothetical protein
MKKLTRDRVVPIISDRLRDWHRPIAKGRTGAMPSDLWDKLPECSGSIHHLRD